ncbi:MAG TPA: hypothetical protein VLZ05_13785 [Mycobacterium sp.]|nr:hypothetical protein [Mycobacterium sp.]HUH69829.1 hypothetical protein [Mycobacterium sp.]
MGTGSGVAWAAARLPWPVGAGMADPGLALGQVVERACWSGFDRWWSKVTWCRVLRAPDPSGRGRWDGP